MGNDMKKSNTLTEVLKILFTAAVLAFLLMKFVLIPCVVEGSSMNPILQSNDFGYSFVVTRNLGIERFDTVVISLDGNRDSKLLVKRVIGLPGEKVEYRHNHLYINGEYIEEPFLGELAVTEDFSVELGEDEYFCLGDNRTVSRDSRFYGPFGKKNLISTHMFVIFPFSSFGYKN